MSRLGDAALTAASFVVFLVVTVVAVVAMIVVPIVMETVGQIRRALCRS